MNSGKPKTAIARRGLLLVMSSPSGAGKTTLSRALLASDHHIRMSVSVTTRPPRAGELDGKDYFFISKERFFEMRDQGELLEWAEVFGNLYGTPRLPVEDALAKGRDVLFDIDWQGTQQLEQAMRDDLVRIFILPPSADELARSPHQTRPGFVLGGCQAHGGSLARNQPLGGIRLCHRQ